MARTRCGTFIRAIDCTHVIILRPVVHEDEYDNKTQLPFLLLDYLSKLIGSICPNCKVCKKINLKRKRATQLLNEVVAPLQKEDLIEELKHGSFSVIVDETTDISTNKSLAVVSRYVKNAKVTDRFLDLIEVDSCTAKGLFEF